MVEEEYFDVVDEDDRVIGQATRRECHERRLIHRSAMMIVIDADDRIVAHRRSAACDLYPSAWSVGFGGHVGAGETYEEAAARELFEESGLTDELLRIGEFRKRVAEEKENARVYVARATGPVTFTPEEVAAVESVAAEDIDAWVAEHQPCVPETPELVGFLKAYLKRKK